MTLLDDPVPSFELEPDPPTPRGVLARAIPIVVVFALLGLIGTAGTWASFTASTDNPTSFATGSLVLANTVTGGAGGTCYSDDDAGLAVNASECDVLFEVPPVPQQPGDDPLEATITLENVGTIDASALSVHAAEACESDTVGSYSGSTSLCSRLELIIQEYSDPGFSIESNCIYGDGDGTTCEFVDSLTVDEFVDQHGSFATAAPIGDGDPALAVDTERYFRVAVRLPDTLADQNDVQGRDATITLTWRAEQ